MLDGRRTQEQRRGTARAAILDAAIDLVARGGYASMTLADVGQRAGYSRSLATHYFGSKVKLLAAVIEHVVARNNGRTPDAVPYGLGRLHGEVDMVFDGIRDQPITMRAYLAIAHEAATAVPEIRPAIHQQNLAFRRFIQTSLSEGVARGEIRPDLDVVSTALALTAMLRGLVWEWFTDPTLDLVAARRAVRRQIREWETGAPPRSTTT